MSQKMVRKRERRTHLRFPSKEVAQIAFDESFVENLAGLVCNESFSGCSVIALKSDKLVDGASCYVKCGRLAPMESAIRWITELDEDSVRVGLEYTNK